MFETEAGFAETKMLINCNGDYSKKQDYKKGWQDGAEFGYNKANKWHYIKNGDLPKKYANADDRKLFLLVLLKHDDHGKNFFAWVLSYYDFHKKEWLIDYGMGEPYAWYELPERPKLPEEKND